MRIFKLKEFAKWSKKEKLTDQALTEAVNEIASGLYDANLGAHLYKKRVAIAGKGKRAGYRVILAYKVNQMAVFLYGFSKNTRLNITEEEAVALRKLAKIYTNFSQNEIKKAISVAELKEINP